MDRNEKLALQIYYINLKCVCGADKHKNRWSCLTCMQKLRDSDEEKELDRACDVHLTAVEAYLNKLK